jgi:hypothetical protein
MYYAYTHKIHRSWAFRCRHCIDNAWFSGLKRPSAVGRAHIKFSYLYLMPELSLIARVCGNYLYLEISNCWSGCVDEGNAYKGEHETIQKPVIEAFHTAYWDARNGLFIFIFANSAWVHTPEIDANIAYFSVTDGRWEILVETARLRITCAGLA